MIQNFNISKSKFICKSFPVQFHNKIFVNRLATNPPDQSEAIYTIDRNNNDDDILDLHGSFDAAWTKRGRLYNSLSGMYKENCYKMSQIFKTFYKILLFSGHASLIGLRAGKIMGYATRDCKCRWCERNPGKEHKGCAKNHTKSAKAMESDMAVELVFRNELLVKHKVRIRTLIGDDDSSANAALRRLSPYTIFKWSDFNHVRKTFNTKLWEIRIPANLREYFSKIFNISIKQNKVDPVAVKSSLLGIVPHAFEDHSSCHRRPCQEEKDQHVYKYFKDNNCLMDAALKKKIDRNNYFVC